MAILPGNLAREQESIGRNVGALGGENGQDLDEQRNADL